MTSSTKLAKEFAEILGFKGRFLLLLMGIVGLFFPGMIAYSVLLGVAKGLKDADIQLLLEELRNS